MHALRGRNAYRFGSVHTYGTKRKFHSMTLKSVGPIFPGDKEVRQYAESDGGKTKERKNFLPDFEAVWTILQFTVFAPASRLGCFFSHSLK